MFRPHRVATTVAVGLCLVGAQGNSILFASEEASPTEAASSPVLLPSVERSHLTFAEAGLTAGAALGFLAEGSREMFRFGSTDSSALAGQIYRGRPVPMRANRDGSIAAMMIGAAAAITGASLLVYANRPDCNMRPTAGGVVTARRSLAAPCSAAAWSV